MKSSLFIETMLYRVYQCILNSIKNTTQYINCSFWPENITAFKNFETLPSKSWASLGVCLHVYIYLPGYALKHNYVFMNIAWLWMYVYVYMCLYNLNKVYTLMKILHDSLINIYIYNQIKHIFTFTPLNFPNSDYCLYLRHKILHWQ
jgi:hypothetical protein